MIEMRHVRVSTRFGGLEIVADAGLEGCTLPARPTSEASTVTDVPKKSELKKSSP